MKQEKADELLKLTKEFVNSFNDLAGEEKDFGLVLALRTETKEHTQGVINVRGTNPDVLLTTHLLNEQTKVIDEYIRIKTLMALDEIHKKIADNKNGDDATSSSSSDAVGE